MEEERGSLVLHDSCCRPAEHDWELPFHQLFSTFRNTFSVSVQQVWDFALKCCVSAFQQCQRSLQPHSQARRTPANPQISIQGSELSFF